MKAITNIKHLKNIFLLALFLFSTSAALAQEGAEEKPKLALTGSVDAYYRANLNSANAGENYSVPGSSFANLPGFALGMANVIVAYEGKKVGFVADLVFGPRGEDAVFGTSLGSSNIINQLYAYWNVSDKVKLTFGNFNTFLGYEVISPVANFNYSTSYLFSYGPFSHAGLKADFAISDDFSLMLAVMNPTDQTTLNISGTYAFGAQLGCNGQYLNALVDHGAFEIDFTGGFDLSDSFFLGINVAYFDNDEDVSFAGVALYPQLATSDNFTIGLRGEYFTETNLGAIGANDINGDANVFAVTLTGSATIGDLIIKPELRLDSASEDTTFLDNNGETISSLSSFVLAAIYSF